MLDGRVTACGPARNLRYMKLYLSKGSKCRGKKFKCLWS